MLLEKSWKSDDPEVMKKALRKLLKGKTKDDILFACIGTDRSTGDSLGPWAGTILKDKGYHVVGTLDDPLHAVNMEERLQYEILPSGKFVVAIDACLGQSSSIGKVSIYKGGIRPGAGVQKELPEIGDIAIAGIVNVGGFMEYSVLQNTRLSLVYRMSSTIADAIHTTLKSKKRKVKTHEKVFAIAR